jgi:hypothetical protein
MSRSLLTRVFAVTLCTPMSALATVDSGWALEPSGTTLAVVQSAAAAGETGSRVLQVEAPVFMGDRIKTGSVGEAQLRFRDQTRLVVGKNSSLLIDSFVFNDNNTASKVGMQALRGTFRFITGVSQKQAYSIRTPSMTIGVRGTRFDFSVSRSGETTFALFEGGARVCDRAGRCLELTGRCAVVVSSPGRGIRQLEGGTERAARLRADFPYIASQARLLPDFRVDTSSCIVQHASLTDPVDPVDPASPLLLPGVAPPAVLPPPTTTPPAPAQGTGNPGNNKNVGHAGENPSGRDYGGGSRGRGDGHGRGKNK